MSQNIETSSQKPGWTAWLFSWFRRSLPTDTDSICENGNYVTFEHKDAVDSSIDESSAKSCIPQSMPESETKIEPIKEHKEPIKSIEEPIAESNIESQAESIIELNLEPQTESIAVPVVKVKEDLPVVKVKEDLPVVKVKEDLPVVKEKDFPIISRILPIVKKIQSRRLRHSAKLLSNIHKSYPNYFVCAVCGQPGNHAPSQDNLESIDACANIQWCITCNQMCFVNIKSKTL
jgi:hypothetical protein